MTSLVTFALGAALMLAVYRLLGGKLESKYPFLPRRMDGASYLRMGVGAIVAVLAMGFVFAPMVKGVLPN
jgi:hypothetical protein